MTLDRVLSFRRRNAGADLCLKDPCAQLGGDLLRQLHHLTVQPQAGIEAVEQDSKDAKSGNCSSLRTLSMVFLDLGYAEQAENLRRHRNHKLSVAT